MLLKLLLRATQLDPNTLLARTLRRIDRELVRADELDARMEASRAGRSPNERP